MSLTTEQRQEIAKFLEVEADQIPSGQLLTSEDRLKHLVEQTKEAISQGHLDPSVKVFGVIDRDVYAYDEDGANSIDFTAVLTDGRGFVGLADGRGISWFTKDQMRSLQTVLTALTSN